MANRKYKRVYAHSNEGRLVMFEMENGYWYLYNGDRDEVNAYFHPAQYERFNPYLDYEGKVDQKLLKEAEEALKTHDVINRSPGHIPEGTDL